MIGASSVLTETVSLPYNVGLVQLFSQSVIKTCRAYLGILAFSAIVTSPRNCSGNPCYHQLNLRGCVVSSLVWPSLSMVRNG